MDALQTRFTQLSQFTPLILTTRAKAA